MPSRGSDARPRLHRDSDHPGICAVYEAALVGKVPYIAMRLVEGKSLAAKIASAKSEGAASADTSFDTHQPRPRDVLEFREHFSPSPFARFRGDGARLQRRRATWSYLRRRCSEP
jgi:hypothetical protein